MEKSIDEQVRGIIQSEWDKYLDDFEYLASDLVENIMLKIRPYLKVKKKWIGDAL